MPEQADDDDLGWNIGRYTVYGEIASGGMATVHIGRMVGEVGFAKLVAIKHLHSHLAKDPEFLDMFLDEVRLAGRIVHPNVVQPLDVVVTGNEVFLVMEYIHGESLSQLLRLVRQDAGQVPLGVTSSILGGALAGLHAAHEAKDEQGRPLEIVHRDVSPQNLLVGVDGIARVIDFGIAKASNQAHSTRAGDLKGKLAYMAPEQLKGKPITRRTDVYAASIVLWECLSGVRLFDADATSLGSIMSAQAMVVPPSHHNPEVSAALDEVVLKGLAVNPDLRFGTALELATALGDVLPGAPQTQVGTWVASVAAESIAHRKARIEEIERSGADRASRPTAASLLSGGFSRVEELSASLLTQEPSSPSVRSKSGPPPPTPHKPAPPAPSGRKKLLVPSARPSAPDPVQRLATQSVPAADTRRERISDMPPTRRPVLRGTPTTPGPTTPVADWVPAVPGSSMPSLEAPAIPLEPAKPAKITIQALPGRTRSLIPYAWIVVGLGLLVLTVLSPEIVRRRAIQAAAADGLTMSIGSVDISLRGMAIELKNVNVTNAALPGCSLHADLAIATVDGLGVDSVTLHNASVALDGPAPALTEAFGKWSDAHSGLHVLGGAHGFRIANGRILWTGVLGPGTKAEGSGLLGEVARTAGRPLGADLTFTFPAVTLDVPGATIGPWRFEHTREASATKTKIQLDPGAPGGPGVTVTTAPGAPTVVSGKFSRATLASTGIPPAMLGQKPDDPTKLDLTLHAELSERTLSGDVRIALAEMRAGVVSPVDGAISGRFSGDRTGPIGILDGTLTLGRLSAPLAGALTAEPDALRIQVAARLGGCEVQIVIDTKAPSKSGGGFSPAGCKLAR